MGKKSRKKRAKNSVLETAPGGGPLAELDKNCIADLLSRVPYEEISYTQPKLPARQKAKGYTAPKLLHQAVAQRW